MFLYQTKSLKSSLPDLPGRNTVGDKQCVVSGLFIILLTGTGGEECIDNDDVKMG